MVIPLILIWAWLLVMSGYVGLSTMAAGIAAPMYVALMRLPHDQPLFYYCAAMALYLIYSHRSNISRMRQGTEARNTRLMVFRRKRQSSDDGQV